MIDIKLIRENKELVKENIRKKFQDSKLPLVDEIEALDIEFRNSKLKGDQLRANKNKISSQIGQLMKEKKFTEAEEIKKQVKENNEKIEELTRLELELEQKIKEKMLLIPNISYIPLQMYLLPRPTWNTVQF